MGQARLSDLAILSTVKDIAKNNNFDDVINDIDVLKAKKFGL